MIDFSAVPVTNYQGQAIGLPTTLCGINGRAAQFFINYALYDVNLGDNLGINVDVTGIAPAIQIDVIRSVYIDNLSNPNDVFVYFGDTKFTAPCARYTAAWVPVVTNLRTATIYGINFENVPKLAVTFTNIFVPYATQQLLGSNGVFPAKLSYVGSQQGGFGTSIVFSAVPLGTPALQRRLIFAASGVGQGSGASTTYGITNMEYDNGTGYAPMSLIGTANAGHAGSNFTANRFGIIRDDTSLNANVRITVTSASPGALGFLLSSLSVFQLLNTNTNVPSSSVEVGGDGTTKTLTLDVPENGCALFFGSGGSFGSASPPACSLFSPLAIASNSNYAVTGAAPRSVRNIGGISPTQELGLAQQIAFTTTAVGVGVDQQFRAIAFAPPG